MDFNFVSIILGIISIHCILTITNAATTQSPIPTSNQSTVPVPIQMPSWLKCLQVEPKENQTSTINGGNSVALVSLHWCSNSEYILNCLNENIPKTKTDNPLDYFVGLNYEPETMKMKNTDLCSDKPDKDQLQCTNTANERELMDCSMRFKQSVDYLYFIRNMTDITPAILNKMACEITSETSRCMSHKLSNCDADIRSFLIGYYGLFTGTECVHNTSLSDEPRRPQDRPEPTVMIKCGIEAATSSQSDGLPGLSTFNASQDMIVTLLQEDCRLYRKRFVCYQREFPSATAFLDIWQKQIFDFQKSLKAYEQFCAGLTDFKSKLDSNCFNTLDRDLQVCEGNYGVRINAAKVEWDNDKTKIDLKDVACNASLERVQCLKQAFSVCGENIADHYSASQLGMLPDECFPTGMPVQFVEPKNPTKDQTTHATLAHTDTLTVKPRPTEHIHGKVPVTANSPLNSACTPFVSYLLITYCLSIYFVFSVKNKLLF